MILGLLDFKIGVAFLAFKIVIHSVRINHHQKVKNPLKVSMGQTGWL